MSQWRYVIFHRKLHYRVELDRPTSKGSPGGTCVTRGCSRYHEHLDHHQPC